MSKKTISILMKIMIIFLALTGVACVIMIRRILDYILPGYSNITYTYWLYYLYICCIPCFCSLVPAWRVSTNIGRNKAFSFENARYMKWIGFFMLADTAIIFIMNILLFCLGRAFAALFIAFFLIIAIFFAITVCAFALSSLLHNASELQEQSDFTI